MARPDGVRMPVRDSTRDLAWFVAVLRGLEWLFATLSGLSQSQKS